MSRLVTVEWLRPKRWEGFRERIVRSRIRGKVEEGGVTRATWRGKLYKVRMIDASGQTWSTGAHGTPRDQEKSTALFLRDGSAIGIPSDPDAAAGAVEPAPPELHQPPGDQPSVQPPSTAVPEILAIGAAARGKHATQSTDPTQLMAAETQECKTLGVAYPPGYPPSLNRSQPVATTRRRPATPQLPQESPKGQPSMQPSSSIVPEILSVGETSTQSTKPSQLTAADSQKCKMIAVAPPPGYPPSLHRSHPATMDTRRSIHLSHQGTHVDVIRRWAAAQRGNPAMANTLRLLERYTLAASQGDTSAASTLHRFARNLPTAYQEIPTTGLVGPPSEAGASLTVPTTTLATGHLNNSIARPAQRSVLRPMSASDINSGKTTAPSTSAPITNSEMLPGSASTSGHTSDSGTLLSATYSFAPKSRCETSSSDANHGVRPEPTSSSASIVSMDSHSVPLSTSSATYNSGTHVTQPPVTYPVSHPTVLPTALTSPHPRRPSCRVALFQDHDHAPKQVCHPVLGLIEKRAYAHIEKLEFKLSLYQSRCECKVTKTPLSADFLERSHVILGDAGGQEVIVDSWKYKKAWSDSRNANTLAKKLMSLLFSEDVLSRSNYYGGKVFNFKEWVHRESLFGNPVFAAIEKHVELVFPGCFETDAQKKSFRDAVNGKCRAVAKKLRARQANRKAWNGLSSYDL